MAAAPVMACNSTPPDDLQTPTIYVVSMRTPGTVPPARLARAQRDPSAGAAHTWRALDLRTEYSNRISPSRWCTPAGLLLVLLLSACQSDRIASTSAEAKAPPPASTPPKSVPPRVATNVLPFAGPFTIAEVSSTVTLGAFVRDDSLRGVGGIPVRFEVVSGGGRTTHLSAVSDAFGAVSTEWHLGAAPGLNRLRISAGSLAPVEFDMEAVPVADRLVSATYDMVSFNSYRLPSLSETGFEAEGAQFQFEVGTFTATYQLREHYSRHRFTVVTTGRFTQHGSALVLRALNDGPSDREVWGILGSDGRLQLTGVSGRGWPPLSEPSEFRRSR